MNIRKTILLSAAAIAFAAPGLSSATSLWHETKGDSGAEFRPDHLQSSKTRAEVLQELQVARQDGSFSDNIESNWPAAVPAQTGAISKTRAEVQQELLNMSAEEKQRMRELYRR